MAEGRGRAFNGLIGALAVALALAGCTAGGPLPAPKDPAPPDAMLSDSAGQPVAVTRWGPDQPKAIILALHGYGDHGRSTFEAAAAHWAAQGIATIAPDQRGFGRNPSRGAWPGADGLIADAASFTAQVRDTEPCAPVILLGHSMGGGIAMAAANAAQADALILAVPAIWGGDQLNPMHRALAWTVALVTPDQRFSGRGVVRIQASDNIEALRALGRDPLYLSPPSAREILGLVRITDRASDAAAQVQTPALMLLGAKDQIVPNRAVRAVFDRLPGNTKVIEYPEGWHLLFRDLQAETVWRDVADWALNAPKPACNKD